VYCILSASAVKNVTLVAYSFYSWADHRRLLLALPSVSSLINEKRFLKYFLEFFIGFFFFFLFVSGQREELFKNIYPRLFLVILSYSTLGYIRLIYFRLF
jgi:hypothetical protein